MAQRGLAAIVCLLFAAGCAKGDGKKLANAVDDTGGTGGGASSTGGSTSSGSTGGAGGGTTGQGGGECTVGESVSCYDGPPAAGGIGQCVFGTKTCQGDGEFTTWTACTGWVAPAAEVCGDNLDNDCNGQVDEGCCTPSPETCDGIDNDCDGQIDNGCVVSGCRLPFPPVATVPCDVPESGAVYYVAASGGSDMNAGNDAAAPWATLEHAIAAAPAGSTVRVAAGDYGNSPVTLSGALTVKGGYDPTFTTWNPDLYKSSYRGQIDLENDGAVWAGFWMISDVLPGGPTPWSQHVHTVAAGSLVRNVVGMVFSGNDNSDFFTGIEAQTGDPNSHIRIACNDVYMSTHGPMLWSDEVISLGGFVGSAVIDSNRVCFDDKDPGNVHPTYLAAGYGACLDGAHAHATFTNNILENAHKNHYSSGIEFYGCGDAMHVNNLDIAVTNNTILTSNDALNGYAGSDGGATLTWRVSNNIIANLNGGGEQGIILDYKITPWVVLAESNGNLIFGYPKNDVYPPPVSSSGDDVSGAWSEASVFVNASAGDFHLLPGGPGAGTGANLFGDPVHGSVTKDLSQAARPAMGPWDRGAFNH